MPRPLRRRPDRACSASPRRACSPGGSRPLRAVVIGDCDFASNSFFPYMSNSDLLLAAVRWLAREERTTTVATRIPVPSLVLLTQGQARGGVRPSSSVCCRSRSWHSADWSGGGADERIGGASRRPLGRRSCLAISR